MPKKNRPYLYSNDAKRSENVQKAFELRKKGMSLRKIGAELGVSHFTAGKYVNEAVAELITPLATEYRNQLLAELDDMIAKTWEQLQTDTPMTQHGKIVRDDDGTPVIDKEFTLKVMDRLLRFLDQRAKLTGAYMPVESKTEQTVVVEDAFSSEYKALLTAQEERNIQKLQERLKGSETATQPPSE